MRVCACRHECMYMRARARACVCVFVPASTRAPVWMPVYGLG